jgi:hypothetical protein
LIESTVALDALVRSSGTLEKCQSTCPIFSRELIRNSIQLMPLDATRCYLLERLYSGADLHEWLFLLVTA